MLLTSWYLLFQLTTTVHNYAVHASIYERFCRKFTTFFNLVTKENVPQDPEIPLFAMSKWQLRSESGRVRHNPRPLVEQGRELRWIPHWNLTFSYFIIHYKFNSHVNDWSNDHKFLSTLMKISTRSKIMRFDRELTVKLELELWLSATKPARQSGHAMRVFLCL